MRERMSDRFVARWLEDYDTGHALPDFVIRDAVLDLRDARAEVAEYRGHFDNALRQAKEVCPDYPWSDSPTMSEIAWAVCSSLKGVTLACGDWRAEAARLQAIVDKMLSVIHYPDNGYHVCRWCHNTTTNGGKHEVGCRYVAICQQIDEVREAAAKETP